MSNHLTLVEALLFASDTPVSRDRLKEIVGLAGTDEVEQAIQQLNQKYQENGNSFRIREIAGGFQMHTLPEYSPWIEAMFLKTKKQKLSKAALETLSIIVYRQPVTRVEIDHIRGVQSEAALKTLLERELVTITGRAQTVGRPLLYGTTEKFLIHFGLKDISELPQLEELEFLIGPAPASVPVVASQELPLPAAPAEAQSALSNPG